MVHENSKIAHENNKALKKYSSSERLVVAAMVEMTIQDRKNKYTMHQVADYMRVGLNTISGRFRPLVSKGALWEDGKQKYQVPYKGSFKTYHRTYFRLTNPPELKPVRVEDHTLRAVGSDD